MLPLMSFLGLIVSLLKSLEGGVVCILTKWRSERYTLVLRYLSLGYLLAHGTPSILTLRGILPLPKRQVTSLFYGVCFWIVLVA